MLGSPNALQWNGAPGHYEVYYLTLTDPATGVGIWIRYTMLAPLDSVGEPASCALWFLAMDPRPGRPGALGFNETFGIDALRTQADPFELRIGDATLTDSGAKGAVSGATWELRWTPGTRAYEHVHPLLRRVGAASTVLVLPHADLAIEGTISYRDQQVAVSGARGGQAHLWGSKHARSWTWAHCNDFQTLNARPAPGVFVDGVSVVVSRFGRELGPSTPVVARIAGSDFISTSPWRVLGNESRYALTGWRFEAVSGSRKLLGEVSADREQLAGVTYHDPDGESAYCYNSETASMRLDLYERARQVGGWAHRETLVSPGRAHFEYAQRTPVPGLELLTA